MCIRDSSIDQSLLADLLGEADLRELLDPIAIAEVEANLQLLGENQRVRTTDGLHDLLPVSYTHLPALLLPDPDAVTNIVVRQLSSTALFAAKFREASARALLHPRRRPQTRAPLWQQRKRASDLLAVASRYPSFPMLLEAYRECLRDTFDMPALIDVLRSIKKQEVQVHVVDTPKASPFAASLLFGYTGNFIYDGDAPLAERRAAALSIDQSLLADLLGEADLRELLDPIAIAEVEANLQLLGENQRARSADAIHDLLLRLGDLSRDEIALRVTTPDLLKSIDTLVLARRILQIKIAGQQRFVAVEDAARYLSLIHI